MKLTIPGVTIDSNVAAGTQLTAVGTVTGSFSAIADSAAGNRKVFSFTWNGVQWPDGKDAVATDNDTIQLTVTVAKDETPETPETPSTPAKPSKKEKTPYTGDPSVAAPLAALFAGMTAVMTSLGITKRRKNK